MVAERVREKVESILAILEREKVGFVAWWVRGRVHRCPLVFRHSASREQSRIVDCQSTSDRSRGLTCTVLCGSGFVESETRRTSAVRFNAIAIEPTTTLALSASQFLEDEGKNHVQHAAQSPL